MATLAIHSNDQGVARTVAVRRPLTAETGRLRRRRGCSGRALGRRGGRGAGRCAEGGRTVGSARRPARLAQRRSSRGGSVRVAAPEAARGALRRDWQGLTAASSRRAANEPSLRLRRSRRRSLRSEPSGCSGFAARRAYSAEVRSSPRLMSTSILCHLATLCRNTLPPAAASVICQLRLFPRALCTRFSDQRTSRGVRELSTELPFCHTRATAPHVTAGRRLAADELPSTHAEGGRRSGASGGARTRARDAFRESRSSCLEQHFAGTPCHLPLPQLSVSCASSRGRYATRFPSDAPRAAFPSFEQNTLFVTLALRRPASPRGADTLRPSCLAPRQMARGEVRRDPRAARARSAVRNEIQASRLQFGRPAEIINRLRAF
jgi:hypothetical protein